MSWLVLLAAVIVAILSLPDVPGVHSLSEDHRARLDRRERKLLGEDREGNYMVIN